MRWIAALALLLVLTGPSRAAGPDDVYVDVYNQILQADTMVQNGHSKDALPKYLDAQSALKKLKAEHPTWNADVVNFRLDYLTEKLQEIGNAPMPTNAPATIAAAPLPSGVVISNLESQVHTLTTANIELEGKLKEALANRVDPTALTAANLMVEQRNKDIASLQAQAQSLLSANGELQNKLKEALSVQPAAVSPRDLAKSEEKITALQKENDLLKVSLEQAKANQGRTKTKETPAPTPTPAPTKKDAQLDKLRAELAVLEAKPVPYTAAELAVLKPAPSAPVASLPEPSPTVEKKHTAHSMKDLPPGAGALMMDAKRASMERDYPKAAEKYEEILRQDENNVYVLSFLADTQFAMGKTAECDKTVKRALALDPEDAASLYLQGVLRLREDKLEEALASLSLAAKYNPTNAGTQNYLGCALARKGLRPAAETAFRKALEFDPDYPEAHLNLALVYAKESPPSLELARWHYKRALDLGEAKSPELEKLLGSSP